MVNRRGCSNQRVSKFHAVASRVLAKIFPRAPADLSVNRYWNQRREELLDGLVFLRPRAVPDFRNRHGRTHQRMVALSEIGPLCQNGRVAPP